MKKPAVAATKRHLRQKARRRRESVPAGPLPVQHPNASGIDIAVNDQLWVAVNPEAEAESVREFSPRTKGVRALCAWLLQCQVDTVAIEATGSYWLSLYLALRQAGLAVVVVNPRAVRMLKRKSDVSDCQWLRYLHSVGLLQPSFVPVEEILRLRVLSRHRENLLRAAGEHVQRLQKALDEMNLHFQHVLDDVMGASGRAIVEAILQGERDPARLAALCHGGIKASREVILESLEGDWRAELLLVAGQEYATWQHLQAQVAALDAELLQLSEKLPGRVSPEAEALLAPAPAEPAPAPAEAGATTPAPRKKARRRKAGGKNEPAQGAHWHQLLIQLFGVDLTLTPGISLLTAIALLCELGTDWSAFPTAGHFASWLGLCPDHHISGGKVLSRSTRTTPNRLRNLLKMGAQSLWASKSHLGEEYRRQRGKLGPAKANTALAHKLARLLWHQVQCQDPYNETYLATLDHRCKARSKARLSRAAAALGYQLIPFEEAA